MTISSQNFSTVSGARLVATFTGSTIWTVPTGVTKYYVDVQGAGGGNGGSAHISSYWDGYNSGGPADQPGGSGGRGGSAAGWQQCTPGSTITITIGARGTNGLAVSRNDYLVQGNAGTNGGTTTVGLISATGGTGGAGGSVYYSSGYRPAAAAGTPGSGSVPSNTLPGPRPPAGATYGVTDSSFGTGDGAAAFTDGIVYLYIPL